MCIHLNRLSHDMYGNLKLNKSPIKFPFELDLSIDNKEVQFCLYDINLKYKLKSVIEHHGSMYYGHYVNSKWVP